MQQFKECKGLICDGKTAIKHYPSLLSHMEVDITSSTTWVALAGDIFAFKLRQFTAYGAHVKQKQ